jgi:hypothetical protein
MSEICDIGAVTAVQLTPCHWVAIADVSKQCLAFIRMSQVDGVEFFTSNLIRNVAKHSRNYAAKSS